MEKKCISCGMPMLSPADHAMGDEMTAYCGYCAHDDGTMKSYEESLASMTDFIAKTRHLAPDAAHDAAVAEMSALPAWRDRGAVASEADSESCGA